MYCIIDLSVVPMGVGVSVSRYVAACQRVFSEAGLTTHMHSHGTNVEGDWDDVFAAVKRCHEIVHEMGAPRISANMRIGTRTDRGQTIERKVASVERILADDR